MKNHFCSNPLCLAKVEKKGDLCDECEQENSYTTVYMSIEDNKKMLAGDEVKGSLIPSGGYMEIDVGNYRITNLDYPVVMVKSAN